jgi:hypothetical protein
MALKEATKEAIYLADVFNSLNTELKLGYIFNTPTIIVDSNSAKKLAENPEFHKRTKHMEIVYHFTRQAYLKGKIKLIQIPSTSLLADFLTKNVTKPLYKAFISLANLGENPK